jgi:hypothetical protein
MKKGTLLMVFALIASLSLTAFAGTVTDDVRIVNTSALDPFEYQKQLDDDDLRHLAVLSVSENPELFPTIESFELIQDESELDIHGSIDPETEKLEFISMPYTGKVGKYDVAVVKPDGSIERYDREVIIDYKERTINTYDPLVVEEGDVVLLFAKEYVETAFEGVEMNFSGNGGPDTATTGRQPGNNGTTAGNNNNGNNGAAAGHP